MLWAEYRELIKRFLRVERVNPILCQLEGETVVIWVLSLQFGDVLHMLVGGWIRLARLGFVIFYRLALDIIIDGSSQAGHGHSIGPLQETWEAESDDRVNQVGCRLDLSKYARLIHIIQVVRHMDVVIGVGN